MGKRRRIARHRFFLGKNLMRRTILFLTVGFVALTALAGNSQGKGANRRAHHPSASTRRDGGYVPSPRANHF